MSPLLTEKKEVKSRKGHGITIKSRVKRKKRSWLSWKKQCHSSRKTRKKCTTLLLSLANLTNPKAHIHSRLSEYFSLSRDFLQECLWLTFLATLNKMCTHHNTVSKVVLSFYICICNTCNFIFVIKYIEPIFFFCFLSDPQTWCNMINITGLSL